MIKIDRAEFLNKLESVLPGISTREIIEQSSCVIFQDGFMTTYNDEIACTQEMKLDIVGAVAAMPLVNILRKLQEDTLEIETKGKHLVIKGKRRVAKVIMDAEILLPTDGIEKPKKWKELPAEFADAVAVVQACAGKDESRFDLTCVHVHPTHIEACDGAQAGRYMLDVPIKKPTLIRRNSLKYIESMNMIEFSRSANWIHFRNSDGLVLSCRRWIYTKENFPDLDEYMSAKGKKTVLPKGMVEAVDKAKVFSSENPESDEIEVQLTSNKIKITGKGATGRYTEHGKIKYKGKDMRFSINPQLFSDLVSRHNKCFISEKLLKVKTGNYTYITALKAVE